MDTSANAGLIEWAAANGGFGSPVIGAGGTIYVGSFPGLVALNRDGSQKWAFSTAPGGVESAPAIGSDGTIYVGATNQNFYAINPDGSRKWTFDTEGPITSSPAIGADGTIYVDSYERLYAIIPDGSQKWELTAGSASSPAIGPDGTIYVSEYEGLEAISPDGSEKWKFSAGQSAFSPAIGADGTIYLGAENGFKGKLYAVAPDGSEKWEFDTAGEVYYTSPGIGPDGTVYVGSIAHSGLYRDKGQLDAVNPDGSRKWEFTTGGGISSSPVIGADGTIYVSDYGSNFYAINPAGSQKWRFEAGLGQNNSPAIGADGTIYFPSGSGSLYALGPLTAAPVNIKLNVSPSSIDFGSLYFSADSDTGQQSGNKKVVVTNPAASNGPLVTFGAVRTSIAEFAVQSNGCASPLAPGESCAILVNFTPSKVGDKGSQQLIITDNASPNQQVVALNGKGVPPPLGLSTRSINFGMWHARSPRGEKKVLLKNLNQFVPITIENLTIKTASKDKADFSRAFNVDSETCTTVPLAPGKTCEINVSFFPVGGGREDAELDISDDASGSPQNVHLTGINVE